MSRLSVFLSTGIILSTAAHGTALADPPPPADYYVSTAGNDAWPGTQAQPFATIDRARLAVRTRIAAGLTNNLLVYIRGGTYRVINPIVFGLPDSPPIGKSVSYAAFPGEEPTISGGKLISGWTVQPDGTWRAHIPEVQSGGWRFRELFVNGQRRTRARHPNTGYLRVAGPGPAGTTGNRTSFEFAAGELPASTNLANAEILMLHEWTISRVKIAQVNHATRILTVAEPLGAFGLINSIFQTEDHPRYAVENDLALLDAPGEWHLNTSTGVLIYRPMPGEFIQTAEIVAPKATELLVVRGDINAGAFVQSLRFVGLGFEHCAWALPSGGYATYQAGYYEWRNTSTPYTLPSAITFEAADGCTIENGRVTHCGGWGVMLGARSLACRLVGTVISDIAGNGVLVGEDRYRNTAGGQWWITRPEQVALRNTVDSCLVQDCGTTLHDCVGIWMGLTDSTTLSNNIIRRIPYTGISMGGLWNTTPSPCRENQAVGNHIYEVMQVLSDGAGIYTVGNQPNSRITGNRIHDVPINPGLSENNGVYLDEGSTGFIGQDNGIFGVIKSPFRAHAAGINSLINNTVRLSAPTVAPIRFQNMNPANIIWTGNLVINPAAPPNCVDPVCDEAISAGILPALWSIVFSDRDADGTPDVDDACPYRAPGDVNGDSRINGNDVDRFIRILLGEPIIHDDYCAADLDGDQLTQIADLAGFVAALLAG